VKHKKSPPKKRERGGGMSLSLKGRGRRGGRLRKKRNAVILAWDSRKESGLGGFCDARKKAKVSQVFAKGEGGTAPQNDKSREMKRRLCGAEGQTDKESRVSRSEPGERVPDPKRFGSELYMGEGEHKG